MAIARNVFMMKRFGRKVVVGSDGLLAELSPMLHYSALCSDPLDEMLPCFIPLLADPETATNDNDLSTLSYKSHDAHRDYCIPLNSNQNNTNRTEIYHFPFALSPRIYEL